MIKHLSFCIVLLAILIVTGGSNCNGPDPVINYETGTFPEEVVNLEGINSQYDDYNSNIPQIGAELPILFSSNRESIGEEFDIITGVIWFLFNQTDGEFTLNSDLASIPQYEQIENTINNEYDQLGPYYLFNSNNGKLYFFYTDESVDGDLDIRFLSYYPPAPGNLPVIDTTSLASVISSPSNDGYITFDDQIETAYFTSDRNGDYDIFNLEINQETSFENWLMGSHLSASVTDSINSDADDKCPFIFQDYMLFVSDRAGGFGGFDIYFSYFKDEKWSSPINLGPSINSSSNEYRPLIGFASGFTNLFILFSSDRPGGAGGYDLFFTGIDLEALSNK